MDVLGVAGSVKSISDCEGSGKPDGTLFTNVRSNHRTDKHLVGDYGNLGFLLVLVRELATLGLT